MEEVQKQALLTEYHSFEGELKRIGDFQNEVKTLREKFFKKQEDFENEKKELQGKKEELLKKLEELETKEGELKKTENGCECTFETISSKLG